MGHPKLAHLVLKPTLACTARCKTCSTRKTLHTLKRKDEQFTIHDWKGLFSEVSRLGVNKLTISGGEPTLYTDLLDLLVEGKKYGWEMTLNTNGSLIDRDLAIRLRGAGLDAVTISLYSPQAALHDTIRGRPGLWQKAVTAAGHFSEIRNSQDPDFRVNMQTLLCRDNFRDFPELLRLAYHIGFSGITFSYLEGDFQELKYLLDERQIREFKRDVIPAAVGVIRNSPGDVWTKKLAVTAVQSIYPEKSISVREYSKGIYRPPAPCRIPSFFSIVLANGDVHPCNMVEYTHYPVVGNLREKTFGELWRGEEWTSFREKGFESCRYCPVPQQVYIPVRRRPEFARLQYLMKNSLPDDVYPALKKIVFSRRNLLKLIRRIG